MGAIAPKEDAKGGRFLTPFAQWVQLLRNGCNCSEKCTPITRKKCPFGQLLGGFAPKNGGSQQVKYWVLLLRIMHVERVIYSDLIERLAVIAVPNSIGILGCKAMSLFPVVLGPLLAIYTLGGSYRRRTYNYAVVFFFFFHFSPFFIIICFSPYVCEWTSEIFSLLIPLRGKSIYNIWRQKYTCTFASISS